MLTEARLQAKLTRVGVEIHRAIIDDIADIPKRFPSVSAIFNCTGLGAFSLRGVEDTNVYPAKVASLSIRYLEPKILLILLCRFRDKFISWKPRLEEFRDVLSVR